MENLTTDESRPPRPAYNPYAEQSVYNQRALRPCDTHGITAHPGRGLGIAALVVAIVALVPSWIPFLNNISVVLGAIALLMGLASIVQAVRGKGNKWWGSAASVIAATALALGLTLHPLYSFF